MEIALALYEARIGLEPADTAVDASVHKAPAGGEGTGKSPVDRDKLGWKWSLATDANGPTARPCAWPGASTGCAVPTPGCPRRSWVLQDHRIAAKNCLLTTRAAKWATVQVGGGGPSRRWRQNWPVTGTPLSLARSIGPPSLPAALDHLGLPHAGWD
jgi:hypothetical protein